VKNIKQVHQFCHALLSLGLHRSRAMSNYVMSLASSIHAQSPVDLSGSEFCHYHYSNLTKVLENWNISENAFQNFIKTYLPTPRSLESGLRYYAMTHDVTKMLKPHSPCLSDRQYVQPFSLLKKIPMSKPIRLSSCRDLTRKNEKFRLTSGQIPTE
jgi:hypothetical protein